eukprot:TRINITY_DN8352_c0_g5_i2.p2 TRINITY_DN8352_c0_g5~~TRINITY_DN8352_c0_g5_i2.p2  ORF type:complete len:130 (+),score=19.00 TRINITY_DN8352_c0_g5_i2:170-559(+)
MFYFFFFFFFSKKFDIDKYACIILIYNQYYIFCFYLSMIDQYKNIFFSFFPNSSKHICLCIQTIISYQFYFVIQNQCGKYSFYRIFFFLNINSNILRININIKCILFLILDFIYFFLFLEKNKSKIKTL